MIKRLHALLNSNCHLSIVFNSTKKLERKAPKGIVVNILYLFVFHFTNEMSQHDICVSLANSLTISGYRLYYNNRRTKIYSHQYFHANTISYIHLPSNYKTFHNFLFVRVCSQKKERM